MRRLHGTRGSTRAITLALAAAVVAVAAVVVDRFVVAEQAQRPRPKLQRIIEGLVTGRKRIAPGVTAYVSGPHGTWIGAAGLADVVSQEPMRPDARLRLASVSKLWTAVVVLRLAQQKKLSLDDTVARWLPGLLPYGGSITVRQLLSHTSGMVDSNDILHYPARSLREIRDPALRARIQRAERRLAADPGYEFSPRLWVDIAAALPLVLPPGRAFHYSSIGYDVAGLVAERAANASLAALVRREITGPLALSSAAYDPHSTISGPHVHGYRIANGALTDTTAWTAGIGAGGSMVSDAADEARFLTALMDGKLLGPAELAQLETPTAVSREASGNGYGLGTGVDASGCAGIAYGHNGGLDGFETNVFVSGDGARVAVLLLNGRTADDSGDDTAFRAMRRLYCAA